MVAPEKAGQHLTGKGGDTHTSNNLGGNLAKHPLHRGIFRRVQRSNEQLRAFITQGTPAFGSEERLDQFFRDVPGTNQSGDPLGRDQFPLSKAADIGGNALGIPGDDGRMRDRQAEGMPEQRRHRIPVRKCAHHGGLGEGPEPCKEGMRLLLNERDDKQQRHEQQKPGRQGPHANIVLTLRRQGPICSPHSVSPLTPCTMGSGPLIATQAPKHLAAAFTNDPG